MNMPQACPFFPTDKLFLRTGALLTDWWDDLYTAARN